MPFCENFLGGGYKERVKESAYAGNILYSYMKMEK
jgi:hypothetical protein